MQIQLGYVCARVPLRAGRCWSYLTPSAAQADDKHKVKDTSLYSVSPPLPLPLRFSFCQGLQLTTQQANKATTLANKLSSAAQWVLTGLGSCTHFYIHTLCRLSHLVVPAKSALPAAVRKKKKKQARNTARNSIKCKVNNNKRPSLAAAASEFRP